MSQLVASQAKPLPLAPLLQALGLNRATYYRCRIALSSAPQQEETISTHQANEAVGAASQANEAVQEPVRPAVDPLAPSRCRVPGRALTPEEIALMWQTAPPRMTFSPV